MTNKFNPHNEPTRNTLEFAQELRKDQTEAEKKLWGLLRNRKANGAKFRRQHPLGPYIVDFYSHEAALVIEVDGGVHDNPEVQEYDRAREFELNELGVNIIRFSNRQVKNSSDGVIAVILQYLDSKKI